MKNFVFQLGLCLCMAMTLNSCSFQPRLYRSGYHIESLGLRSKVHFDYSRGSHAFIDRDFFVYVKENQVDLLPLHPSDTLTNKDSVNSNKAKIFWEVIKTGELPGKKSRSVKNKKTLESRIDDRLTKIEESVIRGESVKFRFQRNFRKKQESIPWYYQQKAPKVNKVWKMIKTGELPEKQKNVKVKSTKTKVHKSGRNNHHEQKDVNVSKYNHLFMLISKYVISPLVVLGLILLLYFLPELFVYPLLVGLATLISVLGIIYLLSTESGQLLIVGYILFVIAFFGWMIIQSE